MTTSLYQDHLSPAHPLSSIARRLCSESNHPAARLHTRGVVACGHCWEQAIRDDERFAVLFDLPRELTADPQLVDEIAVELACRGERVQLTAVERAAAVARLLDAGHPRTEISRRLRMSGQMVNRLTDKAA